MNWGTNEKGTNEMGTNEMGDQWVGGPMRLGTNEMSGAWVLIGGSMRWGTNEMGDQWDGEPMRWGTNEMGDQWCAPGGLTHIHIYHTYPIHITLVVPSRQCLFTYYDPFSGLELIPDRIHAISWHGDSFTKCWPPDGCSRDLDGGETFSISGLGPVTSQCTKMVVPYSSNVCETVSSNETFGYIGCQGKMSAQCHRRYLVSGAQFQ